MNLIFPRAKQVHIGRLAAAYTRITPTRKIWDDEIRLAEKLLIVSHSPTLNSSRLHVEIVKKDAEFNIHVFNWGRHGLLLPEVSGHHYSCTYDKEEVSSFKACYSCRDAGKQ